jgi:anti-sigma factor RsiW
VTVRDPAVLECREVVEIVSDLLDDALAAADRARVEQHLLVCPPCAGYVAQVKATIVHLSDLAAPDPPAASDASATSSAVAPALVEAFRQWKRKGTGG